ncbi:hypothetical protein HYH03_010365 [Edaphochlamys debaryana]|uniref:Glycosyltransferase n=1 Tax=Edaphochlamys debaryana TaxID=47281 RepID=A0A836BW51_9CHLO|nr:hypothetical protein HYH03_010365 [Edaphochlamys debaryana]|eukprot:KAG2491366.1 hypothetical protein HYH03_010365 [Edaphochlamys debaryana]
MEQPLRLAMAMLALLCVTRPGEAWQRSKPIAEGLKAATLPRDFWGDAGPKFPPTELRDAIRAQQLRVLDARGQQRRLVLMALIGAQPEAANAGMWSLFLESLHNITFIGADGKEDRLSSHLVAVVMAPPNATADACQRASGHRGVRCAPMHSKFFSTNQFTWWGPAWAALSYAKISSLLAALSLGVDVLFLDSDQVFFKNPVPYFLERDGDVLVSSDACMARDDVVPEGDLPHGMPVNIGLLYIRAKPMAVRMAGNWLATLVASETRWVGQTQGWRFYDQNTFHFFFSGMNADFKDKAPKYLSANVLRADRFPNLCTGHCGCNITRLKPGAEGVKMNLTAGGTCKDDVMRSWFVFHSPCVKVHSAKLPILKNLTAMYQRLVGPIGSLSEPLRLVGGGGAAQHKLSAATGSGGKAVSVAESKRRWLRAL